MPVRIQYRRALPTVAISHELRKKIADKLTGRFSELITNFLEQWVGDKPHDPTYGMPATKPTHRRIGRPFNS